MIFCLIPYLILGIGLAYVTYKMSLEDDYKNDKIKTIIVLAIFAIFWPIITYFVTIVVFKDEIDETNKELKQRQKSTENEESPNN